MNLCGLDFNFCATGQATEEIDDTAAADHGKSQFPGSGIAGRFDDGIGAARFIRERFDGSRNVFRFRDINRGDGAEAACDIQRRSAPGQRNNANAATRKHAHKFQADGAATNHNGGISGAQLHLVNTAQDAR